MMLERLNVSVKVGVLQYPESLKLQYQWEYYIGKITKGEKASFFVSTLRQTDFKAPSEQSYFQDRVLVYIRSGLHKP